MTHNPSGYRPIRAHLPGLTRHRLNMAFSDGRIPVHRGLTACRQVPAIGARKLERSYRDVHDSPARTHQTAQRCHSVSSPMKAGTVECSRRDGGRSAAAAEPDGQRRWRLGTSPDGTAVSARPHQVVPSGKATTVCPARNLAATVSITVGSRRRLARSIGMTFMIRAATPTAAIR